MDDTTEEFTTYAFKSWDSPIGIIGTIFLLIVILLVFRMAIFFLLEYLRASLVTFPLLLCSRFSSAYTAALIANFSGTCSPGAILVNNDLSIPFTVAVLLGAVLLAQYAGTLLGGHSGYTAISRFFVASALGTALLAQEFIFVPPEELLDNYCRFRSGAAFSQAKAWWARWFPLPSHKTRSPAFGLPSIRNALGHLHWPHTL